MKHFDRIVQLSLLFVISVCMIVISGCGSNVLTSSSVESAKLAVSVKPVLPIIILPTKESYDPAKSVRIVFPRTGLTGESYSGSYETTYISGESGSIEVTYSGMVKIPSLNIEKWYSNFRMGFNIYVPSIKNSVFWFEDGAQARVFKLINVIVYPWGRRFYFEGGFVVDIYWNGMFVIWHT